MINEGAIFISPEEKKLIVKFVTKAEKYLNKYLKSLPPHEITDAIAKKMAFDTTIYVNKDDPFSNIDPDLTVQFFYDETRKYMAGFWISRNFPFISINLFYFIDITTSKLSSFYTALIHEYIHFKQYKKKKETGKDYGQSYLDRPYLQRPQEWEAWAVTYITDLIKKYNITKPRDLLKTLKSIGLNKNNTLLPLKKQNPKAWKEIMKRAIRQVLASLNTKNKI